MKRRDPLKPIDLEACARCGGAGQIERVQYWSSGVKTRSETCPLCHGSGRRR